MSTAAAAGIDATPAVGQLIQYDKKTYTTIKEGKAYILVPPNARTAVDPRAKAKAGPGDNTQAQNVFYNPIQQFNRDLSVLAIRAFGEDACARKRQQGERQRAKLKRKRQQKGRVNNVPLHDRNHDAGPSQERAPTEEEDHEETEINKRVKVSNEERSICADRNTDEDAVDGGNAGGVELHQVEEDPTGTETSSIPDPHELLSKGDPLDQQNQERNKQWKPRFKILDALSATGLRALRYASEISFATKVVANDRDIAAVNSIKVNIEHNKLASAIETTTGDAMAHMYRTAFPPEGPDKSSCQGGKYDVIDLDPYGTAAPFIDSALQALEDGGLLCVTCTDSGVWASCGYSEKTYSLYGGLPVKGLYSHEEGLRLILHSVAMTGAKYGLAIEPLLSLSIDFYARMFIRVRRSPQEVKFLAGKSMLIYACDAGCGAWATQPLGRHQRHKDSSSNWKFSMALAPAADRLCAHCGSKMHIAGPMWGGPIHNAAFIAKILNDLEYADDAMYETKPRIEGMLHTALDELSVNGGFVSAETNGNGKNAISELVPQTPPELIDHHPFYFMPSALCKVIKAQAPRDDQLKGALRHAGYIVARTHCKAGGIKTNAPWNVIWEIMREWVRQKSPIKDGALKESQAGYRIMKAMRDSDLAQQSIAEVASSPKSEVQTPDIVTENTETISNVKISDVRQMKVVFDEKLGKDKPGKRLVRYQQNPRENWGPMARAKGGK